MLPDYTYRWFVNDDGAGQDIMVLGHLVGDSLGAGIVLHSLLIVSSMLRYFDVCHQGLTTTNVEESGGQEEN